MAPLSESSKPLSLRMEIGSRLPFVVDAKQALVFDECPKERDARLKLERPILRARPSFQEFVHGFMRGAPDLAKRQTDQPLMECGRVATIADQ